MKFTKKEIQNIKNILKKGNIDYEQKAVKIIERLENKLHYLEEQVLKLKGGNRDCWCGGRKYERHGSICRALKDYFKGEIKDE